MHHDRCTFAVWASTLDGQAPIVFAGVMQGAPLIASCALVMTLAATALARHSDTAQPMLCTSAVASGAVTADGRPLLWKNRDTSHRDNEIVHFPAEEASHAFVAVCNAGRTSSVWGGLNSQGFAIINTLTPDMRSMSRRSSKGLANGALMKRALQTCSTVDEFELLLEQTNETGRRTVATFSVIDAHGGAATFDTGPGAYVRFDADSHAAARTLTRGLNVRSNFSYAAHELSPDTVSREALQTLTGVGSKHRHDRAAELCLPLAMDAKLSVDALLERVVRDQSLGEGPDPEYLDTAETLSRRTSVSAMVFQGVKPGEDPATATMWVMLGEPALSSALPVWVAQGRTSPLVDGPETGPLSDLARAVREALYTHTDGALRLHTPGRDDLQARTLAAERRTLEVTHHALGRWRSTGVEPEAMRTLHDQSAQEIFEVLAAWLEDTRPTHPPSRPPERPCAAPDHAHDLDRPRLRFQL